MKISLQITYQEKGTQTKPDTTEEILKAITTLSRSKTGPRLAPTLTLLCERTNQSKP